MDVLASSETVDELSKANGIRWYGLRRGGGSVLSVVVNLISRKRKRGQSKKT